MARPQTDIEAGRKELLDTVEDIVRERGAVEISMAEVAAAAGMSPSNIYRFFESKEALLEAGAENWFADKIAIMEQVTASGLPVEEKLYQFFAMRFASMLDRYDADPELFKSYCELGAKYFEVIRGYVDLGDHYLAMIVAEAMDKGYFEGISIDRAVSLINQMVQPYCNPDIIVMLRDNLSDEKLQQIINIILTGMRATKGDTLQSGLRVVLPV